MRLPWVQRYLYNPSSLSQFYGQVSASGAVQWFLTDNVNSIRQLISTGGSVLDAITYDPFGNIVSQTNASSAPLFLFAGGALDSMTGNDQFDRRYYSPADGNWLSQDPLSFSARDPNLYRYSFNQPDALHDPSGKFILIGLILITSGALVTAIGHKIYKHGESNNNQAEMVAGEITMTIGIQLIIYGVVVLVTRGGGGGTPEPPGGGRMPGGSPGSTQWIRAGGRGKPPIIGNMEPPIFGEGPIPPIPKPPGPFPPPGPN